ncbi:MAG: DUF481 domain-containing protein [Pseudomonadota bacterium]
MKAPAHIISAAVLSALLAAPPAAAEEAPPSTASPGALAAPGLPDIARQLIDAAFRTEDAAQVAAVADAAKQVFPGFEDAIDAYASEKRAALSSPLFTGGARDEVVVAAELAKERKAPAVEAEPNPVDLKPGKAPEFLGLGAWKGRVGASGVIATGNSQNTAAGLQIEAHREIGALTHNLAAHFDYGKSRGNATQQRWGAAYKVDVDGGEDFYGFARFSYEEDAFSGFDYKLFGGLGVGRRLFKSEPFKWKVEGGPGYQYAPLDDTRAIDRQAAVYASSETDWTIREGVRFEQDLSATWTSPTSTLVSQTSLMTVLTDTLSTGLTYLYRYETDPPAGRVSEDTTIRLNLTYGF